jgi:hypothetical protein
VDKNGAHKVNTEKYTLSIFMYCQSMRTPALRNAVAIKRITHKILGPDQRLLAGRERYIPEKRF